MEGNKCYFDYHNFHEVGIFNLKPIRDDLLLGVYELKNTLDMCLTINNMVCVNFLPSLVRIHIISIFC